MSGLIGRVNAVIAYLNFVNVCVIFDLLNRTGVIWADASLSSLQTAGPQDAILNLEQGPQAAAGAANVKDVHEV